MEIHLTDREADIMSVLWKRDSGTVAEVRDELEDELAYTTVLTVLRTLEEKGYVAHTEEGRAHRYHPTVAETEVQVSALDRLTQKLFRGSPDLLLTRLVDTQDLSRDEVERLRALLKERLEREDG